MLTHISASYSHVLIRVAAMMLEGFEFADCVRKEPAEQQAGVLELLEFETLCMEVHRYTTVWTGGVPEAAHFDSTFCTTIRHLVLTEPP
jgi:hypothetical protein